MIKDNVQKRLKELGLTQNELSAKLGVSRQTLHYYLNGNITISKLGEIAHILGLEAFQLIQPMDNTTQEKQRNLNGFICPYCGNKLKAVAIDQDQDQEQKK